MSNRIKSFGGGCYSTGSRTNQWFQKFIGKAIQCKFYYYENIQKSIQTMGLKNKLLKIIPYIIRPLETELFDIYLKTNHNIPPIFGSNCTNSTNCVYENDL